jgi:low affinity Fe/Cu permease
MEWLAKIMAFCVILLTATVLGHSYFAADTSKEIHEKLDKIIILLEESKEEKKAKLEIQFKEHERFFGGIEDMRDKP